MKPYKFYVRPLATKFNCIKYVYDKITVDIYSSVNGIVNIKNEENSKKTI